MNTEIELGERLTDAAAAAPDQLGVTIEELRRRGARRRRTRIAVTSAAVVLVVAGGAASVAPGGGFGFGTGTAGDDGMAAVGAPPPTGAGPFTGPPAEPGDPEKELLAVAPAATIDTGEAVDRGTLTMWFTVREDRFLQAVGVRGPDGRLSLHGVTNDPDVTGDGPGGPGFHAGWEFGAGQDRFLTGYFVGDVTTVTLTADGRPLTAKTAAWSGNPAVHVWWVRVPQAPDTLWKAAEVRDLAGLDAAGRVVATVPGGGVGAG